LDLVLIHDAARPFINPKTISDVIDAIKPTNGAVPAAPVFDTLKKTNSNGIVENTISRDGLFAAQTPQGFHFQTILNAHQKAQQGGLHDFTDDSALAEWAQIPVKIVESTANNKKLTTNEDIQEARRSMNTLLPDVRTGHGYDVHILVEGNSIRLCGVDIKHDKRLDGHSDADVGLHALTDALLGAVASGDIGSHFPPSDNQWKGAESDQFLRHAAKVVTDKGGIITHCDVTLVCEEPKIGSHRDAMREKIADILELSIDRISVKATTNERVGFIGREEGIAALATATVVMGQS